MNRLATDSEFNTNEEKLAKEIIAWMLKHSLWQDTCVYVNGKRFGDYDGKHYHYENDPSCVFVEDNMNPRDYFDYAGPYLSMSFEGPLYEILNFYNDFIPGYDEKMEKEFSDILAKYGYYYEMGNSWNLTLCKM